MKPEKLSFSPALPCVAYKRLTAEGLISTMSPPLRLVPLCNEPSRESAPAGKAGEDQFASLSANVRQLRLTYWLMHHV